jgi:hypothetical protein
MAPGGSHIFNIVKNQEARLFGDFVGPALDRAFSRSSHRFIMHRKPKVLRESTELMPNAQWRLAFIITIQILPSPNKE